MERVKIRCLTHLDIRGFSLLGDDGMPFITVEALRRNLDTPPTYIDVCIELDRFEKERPVSSEELIQIRPQVLAAINDLKELIGELPIRAFKKLEGGECEPIRDWIV